MKVYIVRHTSVDVPYEICYGQTDVPVCEASFEAEASQVKERLVGATFDIVFTSPLTRCVRLATYCGYADAVRDPRLMELDFGDWEWTFIYDNHSAEVRHWFEHQLTQRAPNGESFVDMQARLKHFLDEQRARGFSKICLFAHGGIHLCAQMLQGTTFDNDIFMHLPPYGSIVEYDF